MKRALHLLTVGAVNLLAVGLVLVLAALGWERYQRGAAAATAPPLPTPTAVADPQPRLSTLPPLAAAAPPPGITRVASMHTTIPERERVDVITYTVQPGDSLFSIAADFGLRPETILWGNFEALEKNPHVVKQGQVLNILPVDGAYYQWQEGDSLTAVAEFFKVDPQVILEYPGNRFDLTITSPDEVEIEPGTWLIIPGGRRALRDWGPPAITRSNPASARYYGAGSCGAVYEGAIGTYTFVWPANSREISGYNYIPGVHNGIDIGGAEGDPVYAVDNGVVVFAGWSDYGFGYLVVIDHGTGWQSAYAHLSAVAVTCGQSVFQGTRIGAIGNTGNSFGAHLHFELLLNGAKVNPLEVIP
ncbi:MAG: M23 family metallopeptidase [Anaerolineae bacterium]|nr:MAG: M23 family metallopeptidase [Anaerolineae bacterium]